VGYGILPDSEPEDPAAGNRRHVAADGEPPHTRSPRPGADTGADVPHSTPSVPPIMIPAVNVVDPAEAGGADAATPLNSVFMAAFPRDEGEMNGEMGVGGSRSAAGAMSDGGLSSDGGDDMADDGLNNVGEKRKRRAGEGGGC
jgi:hypothetical protein